MNDKDFLLWIHDRLEKYHGESPYMEYMIRLMDLANSMELKYGNKSRHMCTIYGSEIEFNMVVPDNEIIEVAQHIWDHPSHYSDYVDGSDSSYYEFLKYLWIKFPTGKEIQLVQFVAKE